MHSPTLGWALHDSDQRIARAQVTQVTMPHCRSQFVATNPEHGMQEHEAQQQKARLESDARIAAMQKELLAKEDQERAELEKEYK